MNPKRQSPVLPVAPSPTASLRVKTKVKAGRGFARPPVYI